MSKYDLYIKNLKLNSLSALNRCRELTDEMFRVFPELTICCGWYNRQEHYWLKDELGVIIDPSKIQFVNLNGNYKEYNGAELGTPVKCYKCGKGYGMYEKHNCE